MYKGISELETKGYTVIPSFLSPELIHEILHAHSLLKTSDNKNYPIKKLSRNELNPTIQKKIMEVAEDVCRYTNIKVNLIIESIFFESKQINFPWHIDHESYFGLQDNYNHLNFYIPLKKPDRNKSGLCIVPNNLIAERLPEWAAHQKETKGEPHDAIMSKDKTILKNNNNGKHTRIPFPLDEISVTPDIGEGDLLLMRGDIFHRTQDADTDRIALSIRLCNSNGVVSLAKLTHELCLVKFVMLLRNRNFYYSLLEQYKLMKTDKLIISDLLEMNIVQKVSRLNFLHAFARSYMNSKQTLCCTSKKTLPK